MGKNMMWKALSCMLIALLAGPAWAMSRPAAPPAAQKEITIAAAANLRYVLPKIADGYTAATGRKVNLMFGATGSIAQQIKAGAPIDLFLSADVKSAKGLIVTGSAAPDTFRIYAIGKLVLWLSGKEAVAPRSVEDLADPRIGKIGIANPDLAPYGNAAREACIALGIWDKIQGQMVMGENVGQVMTYAERGEVDAAFLPYSFVCERKSDFREIADGLYAPVEQALVVPKSAPNPGGGSDFSRYITTDKNALDLLKASGYSIPVKK